MKDKLRDIVLVDDDPVLRNVLSELLKEQGYAVRTASDGFSALAVIGVAQPGILLSDLNMPRMSGFELLSVVRRRFPSIAVIAMSGAYTGMSASPGIAADAFYAKGGSSVFGLLDTLSKIGDEEVRRSRRAAAPIWIPGLPIHHADMSTTGIACPECLRAFSHPIHSQMALLQQSRCPHCQHPVQVGFVAQLEEANRLHGSATSPATRIDAPADDSFRTHRTPGYRSIP